MAVEVERVLSEHVVEITDKLEDSRCMGSGCYGTAYQVTVNGIPRIAKRLLGVLQSRDVIPSEKQGIKDRFRHECYLLSKLDHPNIVQFVGVQLDPEPLLIMENMHTDLDKFLSCDREIPLSIKLSILQDVSSGLVYLHSGEEPIIHRDLTPSNILLTVDVRAKIADLGVSKLLVNYPQSELVHTKCPGALAYMPPEVLGERPVCGTSLDIFSFGHTSLYVANQCFPQVYDLTADVDGRAALHEALGKGEVELLRRRKAIEMLEEDHCLLDIIHQCLQDERKRRPTSKSINAAMKTLCVIHPKSLEDIVSVWGGQVKKTDDVDQSEVYKEKELVHQREIEGLEASINSLEDKLTTKQVDVIELRQTVARLNEEKDQLSTILQAQAKTMDTMKEDFCHFQLQATELIDGIGDKSTEAENLKSEKERIKAEKDKLNMRCGELMSELEARKIEALTYKADFEDERRDREAAAGKKEEEISALHLQYKQKISKLEAVVNNLRREKQSAEENAKQLKQDTSHNVRIADLEKTLKSMNEKLQRVESMKQLKQQKEEEEQKFYSDYLVQLLRTNNILVPSPAEVLQHEHIYYSQLPATHVPHHLPSPRPLPRQVHVDQPHVGMGGHPQSSSATHATQGAPIYARERGGHYEEQYYHSPAPGHLYDQPHHDFEQERHPADAMTTGGQQQTPNRHQQVMHRMRLSQSDPSFHQRWYASTPIPPPPYLRWHSEDSYYSEGHRGQRFYHRQQAVNIPGHMPARNMPTVHQADHHGVMYSRPLQSQAAPHYHREYAPPAHGLSPSESLPANIESLQIIREQPGADEGEDGPGIVTREVEQLAREVAEETSADRDIKTDVQKPFDPNLVCPECNKGFRIGEIQKFRKHVANNDCVPK